MAYIQDCFPLVSAKKLNAVCCDFIIDCPEIAVLAKAGQFVHIRCGEKTLRRPVSICEIDKDNGSIRLVFDIRGEGTLWLSGRQAGDLLDILGPLGNGFEFSDREEKAVLVGGGIGLPPLLEAAKAFKGKADAILGFKCSEKSILVNDFGKVCANVFITSDDGSLCEKGFAPSFLSRRLADFKYDVIYSCGPVDMLKAVVEIAAANKIKCYVSMEERMGCGVGACLVCACQVKVNGEYTYKHVCKDGPVFNAEEVVW